MRLLSILFFLPLLALAQDTSEPETEPETTPDSTEVKQESETGRAASSEISEAFRNFKPSEEISSDNNVSFPIDI